MLRGSRHLGKILGYSLSPIKKSSPSRRLDLSRRVGRGDIWRRQWELLKNRAYNKPNGCGATGPWCNKQTMPQIIFVLNVDLFFCMDSIIGHSQYIWDTRLCCMRKRYWGDFSLEITLMYGWYLMTFSLNRLHRNSKARDGPSAFITAVWWLHGTHPRFVFEVYMWKQGSLKYWRKLHRKKF
jgi:hypothetical protein